MELDPAVRRAIVVALAARRGDASAPLRAVTLARAATVDPEGLIRAVAGRARRGLTTTAPSSSHETLWLHAMSVSGAPAPGLRGIVVGEDGLAVPVVFDADGQALVPRSPGAARLLLANGPD
jgi:hypothetical protein